MIFTTLVTLSSTIFNKKYFWFLHVMISKTIVICAIIKYIHSELIWLLLLTIDEKQCVLSDISNSWVQLNSPSTSI